MKFVSKLLVIFVLIFGISNCFAAEDQIEDDQTIELTEDQIQETIDYINSNSVEEDPDVDQELKSYYEEYKKYLEDYYNEYEREKTYKAKVVEAGEAREKYEIDYSTYSISKYYVQSIKVEMLEGEHENKIIEMDYILTGDSLNNIVFAQLQKGDVIFVSLTENEDGSLSGEILNGWSAVQRVNVLLIIGIILILLAVVYGGKKGFSTALVVAMIFIFATIILPNFAFEGSLFIAVAILEIICLISAISVIHLGVSRNSLKTILLSIALTAFAILFIYAFNYITRTVGIGFEFATISDNIVLNNINFEHMYYIITLVIASVFITNTACMAVKKIDREGVQEYSDKVYAIRGILPFNLIPLFVTALTLYLPNHVLLISNKFRETDIINSETLASEVIRVFVIALCTILVIPIVSIDKLGFGKKYLKSADSEEIKTEEKTVSEDSKKEENIKESKAEENQ